MIIGKIGGKLIDGLVLREKEYEELKWLSGGRQQGKTYQLIKDQQKEIKRLNNIINELEEHLLDYLEEWEEYKEDNEFVNGRCLMARDVLHDIHELKEGK